MSKRLPLLRGLFVFETCKVRNNEGLQFKVAHICFMDV